jgi:hypothetical protein
MQSFKFSNDINTTKENKIAMSPTCEEVGRTVGVQEKG